MCSSITAKRCKEEVHLSRLILARSVGHKPESHSNCKFVQREKTEKAMSKTASVPIHNHLCNFILGVSWCPEQKPQRDSLGNFRFVLRPRPAPNLGKAVKSFWPAEKKKKNVSSAPSADQGTVKLAHFLETTKASGHSRLSPIAQRPGFTPPDFRRIGIGQPSAL